MANQVAVDYSYEKTYTDRVYELVGLKMLITNIRNIS